GVLLAATGFSWFLGTFYTSGWAGFSAFGSLFVTLYRGPLANALLAYPSGRVTRWVERGAIASLYVLSALAVVAGSAVGTLVTACLVFAVAADRYLRSTGPERRARLVATVAATAYSAVLVVNASARLAGAGAVIALWAYQIVIVLIAVALLL